MKFDLAAAKLTASVREIVALLNPTTRSGRLAPLRAQLGAQAHRDYQAAIGAAPPPDEEVGVEVPIALSRTAHGVTVELSGRIDVLRRRPDGLHVEELKSSLDGDLGAQALTDAKLQACLYALAIDDGGLPITAEVVVVSLAGDARRRHAAGYDAARTIATLERAVAVAMAEAQRWEGVVARRRAAAAALVFPYPAPRPHQGELIDIIAEGLETGRPVVAAAPTGIGKTVTALLPGMRHALSQGAQTLYLTAKTTQRKLVGETFAELHRAAGAQLTAITLARRDQLCPPGHLRCHPDACPLLDDFERRARETGAVAQLLETSPHLTPRQLYRFGESRTLCPYELSVRSAREADLVIGDLNHVFDAGTSAALGIRDPAVVIVDEAHNLPERARSYFSPYVGTGLLHQAQRELEQGDPAVATELAVLCRAVRETIEHAIASGEEHMGRHEGCQPGELDAARWLQLADEAARLALRHTQARWRDLAQRRDRDGSARSRDSVLELAERLLQLGMLAEEGERELIGYNKVDGAELGVGIVCVDASRRLEPIHRRALGTIAMSATLAPVDYYAELIGLARLDPIVTHAPSPFPEEHRHVAIVPAIGTTYRERDQNAPAIAEVIHQTMAARPGRYLAFFSSFAFLSTVQRCLRLPGRQLLVQPPAAPARLRARLLEDFRRGPVPRLLLAVLGGIFSEGIDLPGDELIGAIVVGPALPPLTFERLLMRHYFDEKHESGFAYAMVYPGLQRVIQAAGRVIRTMEDRGVIVLVGRRFADPTYSDSLPADWFRYGPDELMTDDLPGRLAAFWQASGADAAGPDGASVDGQSHDR